MWIVGPEDGAFQWHGMVLVQVLSVIVVHSDMVVVLLAYLESLGRRLRSLGCRFGRLRLFGARWYAPDCAGG